MAVFIFDDVTDRSKLDCNGVVQEDEKDQCCEELEWPQSGHGHGENEGIKARLLFARCYNEGISMEKTLNEGIS